MTGDKPWYESAPTKMQPPDNPPISPHYLFFYQLLWLKIGVKDTIKYLGVDLQSSLLLI